MNRIPFRCSYRWDDTGTEEWDGIIQQIIPHGQYCEVYIESRSSFRLLIGGSHWGLYACLPDFFVGCWLSTLDDIFYNSEKLIYALDNVVDGTTVASALKALAPILKMH